MPYFTRISVIFLVFFSATSAAQQIKVAAIDWCPQICPQASEKGYIIETIDAVFEGSAYQLTIDYFPWSRAIKGVEDGSLHLLLAPAKKEAPHLIYPEQPVGFQQMCFFTQEDSNWEYTGPNSLLNQRVGIAQDTSIVELNEWRLKHPEVFQYLPYHERFIKQNVGKLNKQRIDSFIFTRNSTNYLLKSENISNVRNAGCVSKEPVYAAITPALNSNIDTQALKSFIDKRLLALENKGKITEIKRKYSVE